MNYFVEYHLFERTLKQAEEELLAFQKASNITITLEDLLSSIEATRVSLHDLFLGITNVKTIEKVYDSTSFLAQLRAKKMRIGEILDTGEHYTFIDTKVKCAMIYSTESSELDTPIYLLLQRKDKNKWSTMELYYVQADIANFFRKLTSLYLVISNHEEVWEYSTSNSGEDWLLQQGRKTDLFKTIISWKNIDEIRNIGGYKLIFE